MIQRIPSDDDDDLLPATQQKQVPYPVTNAKTRKALNRYAGNPAIGDLRPGIAILDTFIAEELEALGDGDGKEFREQALKLWRDSMDCREAGDIEGHDKKQVKLGEYLESGVKRQATKDRIVKLVDKRTKHASAFNALAMQASQAVTYRELNEFMDQLIEVGIEFVPEEKIQYFIRECRSAIVRLQGSPEV